MSRRCRELRVRRWGTRIALAAALALGFPAVHADEDPPALSLRGFYTLNLSTARENAVVAPPVGNERAQITLDKNKGSLEYSVIGAQADLAVTEGLHATAQVVSAVQTGHDNRPVVDWAYLSQDLGNDLYLRGGRLKTPLLQGTELRYVGFSRLWVRPLVPNSSAAGMDVYHGLEFVKSTHLDSFNLRLQGGLGVPEHELSTVKGKDIKHFSLHFERDESWIKFAALQAHTDILAQSDGHVVNSQTAVSMFSIESELWLDKAVVNAGYAKGQGEIAPDETLRYLSLGYRREAWTPYLLYQFREMLFSAPPRLPPRRPGVPAPAIRQGPLQTETYALGLRYDLSPSQALKFQAERQYDKDNSNPIQAASQSAATVLSIVFEGVF